ncbi:MAG: competence/damage-inducible protein A [Prolixibacteraceae bacterium]|jgi:nicotinamide-nucleotide amidase|nr:competence/damage-inducible protein A [Prolixibacteraceae bacterium]MBT6005143.1 competence/damage-inducible protein A [Prolixibacteraceae bacterium]MBT6767220.1 competence/damage-inducible protein A [Prolixibacteraceae bacterium]MBT7394378.1 competence/damage-inducible protein A [Prolixibacteraceae bacterium]
MKAEIITIGDEILIGQIIDTNSAWIAEQFNLNGIEICRITTVRDKHDHIVEALKNAEQKMDLVILTGGLGPTKDDITKNTLCEYFNTKLVFHEATFEHIKNRFSKRNIDLNKLNRDQALVPESCTVLPNKTGTAPGMWFEKNNVIFVSLPGVPFEMKYLVEHEVIPRLQQNGKKIAIFHKTVLTQGIPESMLAEKIEDWETALPENIKLAYLPNPMSVRLRLSATGSSEIILQQQVETEIEKLQQIIPESIYGFDNETMAEVIGKLLKVSGKTLAVAESCTGGYISHLITSVPGSSAYYKGSVSAYSNQVKQNILGVNESSLIKYGAVSEVVAKEMALGVKKTLDTDFAVATTGIAGPEGGTEEKPVGTIWIAVAGKQKVFAKKFVFGNNRERNIIRSSQTAMQILRRVILKDL